jgi:hypothetical protein
MSRFLFVSLVFGFVWPLCSIAVGDDTETTKRTDDNGLATFDGADGIKSTLPSATLNGLDVGSVNLTSPPVPLNVAERPFEDKKQQRQYEDVLKGLRSMKLSSGGEVSEDDWFVVGGVVGNQANFNSFQGEEDVARRVVEFVAITENRCQWRIFSREEDSYVAEEMVSKVKTNYQQWKQAQYNRMMAAHRSQQRAASSYRRSSGRSRSC